MKIYKLLIAILLLLFAGTAAANPNDGELYQINATHWYFETTQTALTYGEYNYQAFANNISSEYRVVEYGILATEPDLTINPFQSIINIIEATISIFSALFRLILAIFPLMIGIVLFSLLVILISKILLEIKQ